MSKPPEQIEIIQDIETMYLEELEDKGLRKVVYAHPFSLGGIENSLSHPDREKAIGYVRECVAVARKAGVPETTIAGVIDIFLQARQQRIDRGVLAESEPITPEELLGE